MIGFSPGKESISRFPFSLRQNAQNVGLIGFRCFFQNWSELAFCNKRVNTFKTFYKVTKYSVKAFEELNHLMDLDWPTTMWKLKHMSFYYYLIQ